MAAAIADFRPKTRAEQKIKKKDHGSVPTIELTRNVDILLEIKQQRETTYYPRVVVGFAAESQNLLENVLGKLERKGLDFIVVNGIITADDAGFASDNNRVVSLHKNSAQENLEWMSKAKVSEYVLTQVAGLLSD